MSKKLRVLSTDSHGQPCIMQPQKDGVPTIPFSYHPWYRKVKGLHPLQGLAREVIIGILTNPSIGTIGQVFDSLQPSPKVDEFRAHLLREARWAQRLLNDTIKHLDPESRQPTEPKP